MEIGLIALSFFLVLGLIPTASRYSSTRGWLQKVRSDGPQSHLEKDQTPSATGWVFGIPLLIAIPWLYTVHAGMEGFFSDLALVVGLLIPILALGVGLFDDWLKFTKGIAGLRARWRFLFQMVAGAILGVSLWLAGKDFIGIPFTAAHGVQLGAWIVPLAIVTLSGTINGMNFTDGQDGLAVGCSVVTFFSMGVLFAGLTRMDSTHLPIFTVVCMMMAAACLAFLWYNAYPAQVFMGEVGSTTLGATLATITILTGTELYLLLIGGVYVAEVLSVMLQVFWFRRTGKRLLKMSPLHHHFELSGIPEPQVTTRFWIVNAILCAVGVYAAR